jgi:nitrate reductase delta subunit
MILYKVLSHLLDYPNQGLIEGIAEIREALNEPEISVEERQVINEFIDHLAQTELPELEKAYVKTFDMVPAHSLHLTHHLFGDDRERGPALVDLGEHYKGMGLEARKGELPDFLPLILEYVSTLDDIAARVFLSDALKVIVVIAGNLESADSPYAPLLRVIEGRGHLLKAAS